MRDLLSCTTCVPANADNPDTGRSALWKPRKSTTLDQAFFFPIDGWNPFCFFTRHSPRTVGESRELLQGDPNNKPARQPTNSAQALRLATRIIAELSVGSNHQSSGAQSHFTSLQHLRRVTHDDHETGLSPVRQRCHGLVWAPGTFQSWQAVGTEVVLTRLGSSARVGHQDCHEILP